MKANWYKAIRGDSFLAFLGQFEGHVTDRLRLLDMQKFPERLWAKDASLWKADPETQVKIKNRLGWLSVTGALRGQAGEIMGFARSVKGAGFTHLLLLGMGGSSLCPEVCRMTYGIAPGYPDLIVLDSTDPSAIINTERSIELKKTLFIVASKSGATIEVQSLYRYFSKELKRIRQSPIGDQFIAITDAGTPLEGIAREEGFRKIFLSQPDIGGRYSVLSHFGLVPAALIGVDLEAFLDRAVEMINCSGPSFPSEINPGIRLGAILAELGMHGRDKVTLICHPAISSFGSWLEQLLAESTGKEGKGLIPVDGEVAGDPGVYGDDRLFVYLRVESSPDSQMDQQIQALREAGHPVVQISLRDTLDLAGEFFRFEVATATAGAIMGINPFDEPNVAESKEKTQAVLKDFMKTGRLPLRDHLIEYKGIRFYANPKTMVKGSPVDLFRRFLGQSNKSDYIAVMAYLERSDANDGLLQTLRMLIRDRYHLATTLGYGPRFLHSTGQLHKGGPGSGIFIQISAEDQEELPIPGEEYGFSVLKQAQALGDYLSLADHGHRILAISLGRDIQSDLRRLVGLIEAAGRH